MNISDLQLLILTAKNASYSKTARQLNVSPQYISRKIHAIENDFDTEIFTAFSNILMVTPKGELIIKFAQDVIEQKQILDAYSFVNSTPKLNGNIEVFTTPIVLSAFYDRYIPIFLNAYPDLNIEFHETDGANVFQCVQQNINCLGIAPIITNPEFHFLDHYLKNLDIHLLQKDEYVVLAHPDFFSSNSKTISLHELIKYPVALTVINSKDEMQVLKILKFFGEPNVLITASSYLFYSQLLISKKAYSIFPLSLVSTMPHHFLTNLSCFHIQEEIFIYNALVSNKLISSPLSNTLLNYLKTVTSDSSVISTLS